MPQIMGKKLRGSLWGFLKSFYLHRVSYTRKLLVYRRRKSRHSNGLGIPRNEFEHAFKSQEKILQRISSSKETTSMKTLIEREMLNETKSRLARHRKRISKRGRKSKQSCEFCSQDVKQTNIDLNSSQHCPDHKELGDVLQKIMSSNQTDSFLEIITDPTSLLVTYMRTSRYFPKFTSKEKTGGARTAKNTIIVLKPKLKLLSRSQSFLSHIKIKLKQAVSLGKGHDHIEETHPKLKYAVENESDDNSEPGVSEVYLEAKEYLSETLKDGDLDGNVSTAQSRPTLERILALSESNSSVSSPEGQSRHSFGITSTRLSREIEFQTDVGIEQIVEKDSIFLENPNDQEFLLKSEKGEDSVAIGDATNLEDHADTKEESYEIECVEQIEEDSYDTRNSFSHLYSSPPHSFHEQKVDDFNISIDSTEQPSPVSVLDPFLYDDDASSPERRRLRSIDHPIRLLQIKFEDETMSEATRDVFFETCKEDEEPIKKYVETVLQYFQFSDQFLDPSLIDEVDFPCTRASYEKEVIFDCINEVLLEMYGVLRLNPRAALIPDRETIVHLLVKRVYWHVVPPLLPRTLQQVVEKDLSDAMIWMDLGLETESVGTEMGEVIMEELIAETIVDSSACIYEDHK